MHRIESANAPAINTESPNRELGQERFLDLEAMQAFWNAIEAIGGNEHLRTDLSEVLKSEYQKVTIETIEQLSEQELHDQLQADLHASYGRLGDACPNTWEQLMANLPLRESGGLAANPIDYLSQRLATIRGAEELLPITPQNPDALKRIIQAERDRLARLLIAIERSENNAVETT